MLQIRKVIEHVYEKLLLPLGTVPQPAMVNTGGEEGVAPPVYNATELSTLALERVELLCNDQVRTHIIRIRCSIHVLVRMSKLVLDMHYYWFCFLEASRPLT